MKRKFSVILEIQINNKGNTIYEAHRKQPISTKRVPTLEDAIRINFEQASDYIDVQGFVIRPLPSE